MAVVLWFLVGVCGYFIWLDEVQPRLRVWWARRRLLRLFAQFRRDGSITEADWSDLSAAVKSAGREDES